MYLVDANIFLEALLEQEKVAAVRSFLESTELEQIFVTDLALHSIGIILFRLSKGDVFVSFLEDMIIDGVGVLSLRPEDLRDVRAVAKQFRLDFDDAYRYVVAEKYNLQLVSFDRDFDTTPRKRKEPSDLTS